MDRIYEAAAVPELWRGVLDDLAGLGDCMGGILLAADTEQRVRHVESESLAPLMTAFAEGNWMHRNTRAARLGAKRHAGFVLDSDLYAVEEMDRDPLYVELLRRHGGGWAIGTMIPVPTGDLLIFNIERPYAMGPVPRETVALYDALRPHLARAALLSARLHLERARSTVDMLARLGLPAATVQPSGRMLAANALFEQLEGQFALAVRDRFRLQSAAADQMFEQALTRIGSADREAGVWSIAVPAVEDQPPRVIHLVPVRGAAHDIFGGDCIVLVVTNVIPPGPLSPDLLTGLFDLTAAEARLAALVGTGLAPREAAARLGITEETARTVLKRVFSKVGVARQSELTGLLTRLAPRY